ncbi:hypothetical protein GWI33_008552 [Rhynchophorus ferrugineus]|uniref:Uncharacterized protein n=1 Tax=Rhynchophorus ferrugineus TaxID=354439 RepID=A0A834IQW3_RHYFE|nr:hypothetical protein GWI33_008552 [Rhynchophorus ferrugineus]
MLINTAIFAPGVVAVLRRGQHANEAPPSRPLVAATTAATAAGRLSAEGARFAPASPVVGRGVGENMLSVMVGRKSFPVALNLSEASNEFLHRWIRGEWRRL